MSASPDSEVSRLRKEVEALRGAVAELTVLNEISREIGALVDLDEVLRRIVDRSVAAVEAEEGVITLLDDDPIGPGQTLVRSMATNVHRGPFHLNEHIFGWMQLYRAPLRLDHAANDDRFRLVAAQGSVDALLSVPLLARGRLVGALTVCNRKGGGAFSGADQRLLSIIGSQSAQIIENARLYEEEQALRQMQEELRIAFQIQTRLLPEAPPAIAGYDVAGRSFAAQAVGGDFFDYIAVTPSRIALCVTLEPGDILLVNSDGVTEAMNHRREQFGEERLIETLRRDASGTAGELLDRIAADVHAFVGSAPPSDDLTMLAIIRR